MNGRTWSRTGIPIVVVLSLAPMLLTACAAGPSTMDEPVAAVDALLTLRYERTTDASAYAGYLADPALGEELARASTEETSDVPPTPQWEVPYVSEETTSTASVVVIWKPSDEFPDFPPATVFSVERLDGTWKSVDAAAVEDTSAIPPPLD